MKFKPLGDRILVRRAREEEKSPGGIIIPDVAKQKPTEGVVISAGPGRVLDSGEFRRMAAEIVPEAKVLFAKWQGTEIKVEGEELLIVREDDVLGVLT
jgi:chaperonin GroES